MKKLLAIGGVLFAVMIASAMWLHRASALPSVSVSDVRQTESIVLETSNKHICGLTVRGSGEIDGEATISLMLNDKPYKVEQLQGKVDFQWGGDWYTETAEIRYEPIDVSGGVVVLHYQFN